MNELEDEALHQTVKDLVTFQFNKLGSDLRLFVTDATRRINEHIETKMMEISVATKTLIDTVKDSIASHPQANTDMLPPPTQLDYRQALLTKPPPHVDPRLAAKEGIKLHQFLLDGVAKDSKLEKMSAAKTKKAINQAIDEAGGKGYKVRSAMRQSKEGLLVEMETDAGAAWMKSDINEKAFCEALGQGISVRRRPFNVFTYNVSTAIDPDNKEHLKEISEANDLQEGALMSMRWVKPTNCREKADQWTAHLILSFSNVDNANRAILSGLVICQHHTRISKPKKEPVHCMKCHNWNHVAWECTAQHDTCGGNNHWTKDCINQEKKYCVSCRADDHASWSRSCPVFLKKCEEMDKRTPENSLPFFPALESWTWSPVPPLTVQAARVDPPPLIIIRGRNQQEWLQANKETAPNGRPYERRSWNQSQVTPTDKQPPIPPLPPLEPSNKDPSPLSTLLEQMLTDENIALQMTNSQGNSNA